MPRYYFHIRNDEDTTDDEGTELPDVDAARQRAITEARNLAAESIKTMGHLILSHRIEIHDDQRSEVAVVSFGDVVEIEQ